MSRIGSAQSRQRHDLFLLDFPTAVVGTRLVVLFYAGTARRLFARALLLISGFTLLSARRVCLCAAAAMAAAAVLAPKNARRRRQPR